MLVNLPLISKKHLGTFPAVFFYQHPRTVVWTHLHVGIADVDRNLTTVTPLIPVDPLKRNDPPVPRKQHLKCLKLNIRCPIHGLSGEIALLTFCGILTFCSKASCSLQHMAHVIRFTCILSAKRFSKNFQPQHVNEFPFGKRNFHCYVYQSVIDGLDSWDPQK